MTAGQIFSLAFIGAISIIVLLFLIANHQQEKIKAMNPEDRNNYVFGPVNVHLICPHCQTKGMVHVKRVAKVITQKGTVGGILKAETKSVSTQVVTQHHCAKCTTTWKI